MVFFFVLFTQRSSISPAEREKFRVRSSPDIEPHKKVKKEEKDCHVSSALITYVYIDSPHDAPYNISPNFFYH
jgi:hypothetical protein